MKLIELEEIVDEEPEIVIYNHKFGIYSFSIEEYLEYLNIENY
jgi:hypothetical protein